MNVSPGSLLFTMQVHIGGLGGFWGGLGLVGQTAGKIRQNVRFGTIGLGTQPSPVRASNRADSRKRAVAVVVTRVSLTE